MTTLIPIVALIIVVLMLIVAGYVKAPPDKAFLISGLRKNPRVLVGRAGVKIPFFERVDKLYLGQMTVDIKTEQSVPTNDFINVNVDAVAKVRIGTSPESIQLAAKNFLNKTPDEIAEDLQDSLQGNMREIIGTLSLKAINTDRDSFSDQVMEKASKDMNKLGIEILSCNIQNVTDENGLISDLGMDNTAKIKKDAAIAKAEADKEIAVAQAKATKETAIAQAQAKKDANDVQVTADLEIAQKKNELAIKEAALKEEADTAKAKADAAYEIQKQEQQKAIETNTVNAQIAKAEREAELKAKEVAVQERTLEATVKKQAEADKYKEIQEAEARLEVQRRDAEAKRFAMEQEAAGIRAKGEAEAEAIRARGVAEAEAMEKKAEAYKKYNNMAVAEQMIKIMPQMAAEIAKPLSAIDNVNIYGGDANGVTGISGAGPVVMKQVFDTMSQATGVDFTEILKANTYDAQVNKNINLTGIPSEVKMVADDKASAAKGKRTAKKAVSDAPIMSDADTIH